MFIIQITPPQTDPDFGNQHMVSGCIIVLQFWTGQLEISEIDRKTHKMHTMHDALHTQSNIGRLYMKRSNERPVWLFCLTVPRLRDGLNYTTCLTVKQNEWNMLQNKCVLMGVKWKEKDSVRERQARNVTNYWTLSCRTIWKSKWRTEGPWKLIGIAEARWFEKRDWKYNHGYTVTCLT